METLTKSRRERDWMTIMLGIKRQELTLVQAAELMDVSYRQSKRVWRGIGPTATPGLVHRLRGRPKALRRKAPELRAGGLARYDERCGDFGPTLAAEYLALDDTFKKASESWCAREDLNLQPLRDQILSLARLPFRHARNRRQLAPCTAESQAFVAVLCKPGEMTTATHRATTGDCASRKVCLGSCHVTLVQVCKRCMRCGLRRRVEWLHAVGAKPVERGKRAAFCSGQKPRKRNGFSRRD